MPALGRGMADNGALGRDLAVQERQKSAGTPHFFKPDEFLFGLRGPRVRLRRDVNSLGRHGVVKGDDAGGIGGDGSADRNGCAGRGEEPQFGRS